MQTKPHLLIFNFRESLDTKLNIVQAIRPRFILELVYSFQVWGVDSRTPWTHDFKFEEWIVGLPEHMIWFDLFNSIFVSPVDKIDISVYCIFTVGGEYCLQKYRIDVKVIFTTFSNVSCKIKQEESWSGCFQILL